MLKLTYRLSLVPLSLLAIAFPAPSHGAPAPTSIPMQATFNNVTGDGTTCRITGDGSPYVGGSGVECQINLSTSDFILDTTKSRPTNRTITCDLSFVIPCPADLSSPSPCPTLCQWNPPALAIPSNSGPVGFHLYVQNVLGVTSQAWQPRVAIIGTDSFGTLAYSPNFNGGNCSVGVWVQARDASSWEISTNPPGYPARDLSALYQNTRSTPLPVQYQSTPFELTISRLQ